MKKTKQYLKEYYVNSFFLLQFAYDRSQYVAILLLLVRQIQFISLIFTKIVTDDVLSFKSYFENSLIDTLITTTHYFRLVPLQFSLQSNNKTESTNAQNTTKTQNSNNKNDLELSVNYNFLIFQAIVNSYLIFYLLIRPILLQLLQKRKQIYKTLDLICSFLMKWYSYLLLIPFIQVSIYELFNDNVLILSWYCLISTSIISIFQTIHEFSYSFILKDFLAKRDSFENQLDLVIIYMFSIFYATSINSKIVLIAHSILTLYQIYSFIVRLYFYNRIIQCIFIVFRFCHLGLSLILLLFILAPALQNYCDIQLTLLVSLPILARFALIVRSLRVTSLLLRETDYSDPQILNLYIRNVFTLLRNLDMHDYTIIQKGVLYESIYENHYDQCARKQCFCHDLIRENGFSWEELHGHKYRDRFLTSYLTQIFSEFITDKTRLLKSSEEFHKLRFSFLSFLIEVVNVPTSSYVQVVSMINQLMKQSNIKEQMIFKSMEYKANQTFYNFFNNPSVFNQRLQLNKVMEFDDIYKELSMRIKTCILLLRDMYVMMMEDYINLNKLLDLGTKIIKFKELIYNDLMTLFQYNPNSQRAFEMSQIYSETLDLMKKKPKQYKIEAQFRARKIQIQKNYQNPEKEINLFSQEACVIYVSLLDPIGTIKRISQSTFRVFGMQAKECIGKNCNIFIPNEINKIHDEILNRFVEGGQLKVISAGEIKMFGVKKSGFIFPLKFRIRLDPSFSNDFGVSGFFQMSNSGSEHILFDLTGRITNISEKFFKFYFQDIFGESNFKKVRDLDIIKMLPLLGGYIEQIRDSNVDMQKFDFNTIFIYPLVKDKAKVFEYDQSYFFNSLTQFKNFSKTIKSRKCGFLSISFRIGRLSNSYTPLKIGFIQIEKHKKILDKYQCLEEIEILISNLKERKKYLDIANNILNENALDQQKSIMNNTNDKSVKSISLRQPSFFHKQAQEQSPQRKSIMMNFKKTLKTTMKEIESQQNGDSQLNDVMSKHTSKKAISQHNLDTYNNNVTENDIIYINLSKNSQQQYQSTTDNHMELNQTQNHLITTQNNLNMNSINNNDTVIHLETSFQHDNFTDQNKNNLTAFFKQTEFDIFDSYNFDEQRKKLGGLEQNQHGQYMIQDSVISPKKQNLLNQQNLKQRAAEKHSTSSEEKINSNKKTKDKEDSNDSKHNDLDFENKVIQANIATDKINRYKQKELKEQGTDQTFGAKQEKQNVNENNNNNGQNKNSEQQNNTNEIQIDLKSENSSSFLTDSDEFDDSDQEGSNNDKNKEQDQGLNYKFQSNIKTQLDVLKSFVDIPKGRKKNRKMTLEEIQLEVSSDSNMAGSQLKQFNDDIEGNRDIMNFINKQEVSSVNSGKTEFHSFKTMLRTGIQSKKTSKAMKSMLIAGYLAIAILISITTLFFVSIRNYFEEEIASYKLIVKGDETKKIFSSVITYSELLELHSMKILQTQLSDQKSLEYYNEKMFSVTKFREQIYKFQEEDQDIDFAKYLTQTYLATTLFNQRNMSSVVYFYQIYSLIITSENLYFYAKTEKEAFLRYVLENEENAYGVFEGITDQTLNQSNRIITQIDNILVLSLVSLEIICILTVIVSFPMFYFVQKQREEILKLFCTFQGNKLIEKIDQCFSYSQHNMLESIAIYGNMINKNEVNHNKRPNHPKKRTTSNSNNLKKYNISLIIATFVIFCLLSISPFTNYFTSQEFINEFDMNIQELQKIYQFRGLMPETYALNYLTIKAIAQQRTDYTQKLKLQLDKLSNITNQATKDLVGLNKYLQVQGRYDYNLYQSIVRQILDKEVCQTFKNNIQYSSNSTLFNLQNCLSVYNQIWSNGFIIGVKAIQEKFKEIRALLDIQDPQAFIQKIQAFDQNYDLNSFQELYYYCQSIPDLLGNFMITSSTNYYNERQNFLLQIFIFAFILNSCILLFVWQAFYKHLAKLMFQTKSILGVFSYDFIIDNPFIISYVKKEFTLT
ncbi:transmembrane protein, putative (macronuclear) [Tetrahymena thermophila SB210]|uniref:Transmembrane protein, putative n=1 Tax=Tetrahymena thermophila (strain SB210) TaxID=312017 RepID=Q22X55_TETTS|nr:transmembrane protein, putative [Tetrahymena thermophila SB210]EAR89791.2 transmembrane protein, putative [Tetrahymena thermophila SB210]|eukprot:XP_001010036.2 transmembrane protein, putative [Tetrahymena thermophila SB210]